MFLQAKTMFKESFKDVSGDEIATMEQELINEGSLTAEQITKLCNVHLDVFKESLPVCAEEIPGHPIHTYTEENRIAKKLLRRSKGKIPTTQVNKINSNCDSLYSFREPTLPNFRIKRIYRSFFSHVGKT